MIYSASWPGAAVPVSPRGRAKGSRSIRQRHASFGHEHGRKARRVAGRAEGSLDEPQTHARLRAVTTVVIDTGPLVALLNRRDALHRWVRDVLDGVEPPIFTCEAVVSEACFLLRDARGGHDAVLELPERNIVQIDLHLGAEVAPVRSLMKKFANVPMSLADACLVRMTELEARSAIIALDAFKLLALDLAQAVEFSRLQSVRDPFDRLVVAAARANDVPLVTADTAIHGSALVETIWD